MIAFCMGGGIGDAILCIPVIKKLQSILKDKIVVLYYDKNLTPLLLTLREVELRFFDSCFFDSGLDLVKRAASDCSMIVWNRFEFDNDNKCNYFYANDHMCLDLVRSKREIYNKNLSIQIGRDVVDLRQEVIDGLMLELSFDSNYYSDWNRFGINVGYEDVFIDVPEEVEKKHALSISRLGKYTIFHDSRLPSIGGTMENWIKCWYFDRWNELAKRVIDLHGCKIVQFVSKEGPKFENTIDHSIVIGKDATFFDYLCLLKHSVLYVGTDSWPAHAAIFLPNTFFVILKGASVRRWDHMNKFTKILRKGNCQGCEFVGLDECVFDRGERSCMRRIEVDDVEVVIKNNKRIEMQEGI